VRAYERVRIGTRAEGVKDRGRDGHEREIGGDRYGVGDKDRK
jgi:hypothetical protein